MDLSEVWRADNFSRYECAIRDFPSYSNWVNAGFAIEKAREVLGYSDWLAFKDRLVLDIGCGADGLNSLGLDGAYPPIYCFLMAGLGSRITGIDKYPLSAKFIPNTAAKYHHISCDLVKHFKNAGHLSDLGIQKNSYLVVNTANFTGSTLAMRDPELIQSLILHSMESDEFENTITNQILDLLVQGGVWIQDSREPIVKK